MNLMLPTGWMTCSANRLNCRFFFFCKVVNAIHSSSWCRLLLHANSLLENAWNFVPAIRIGDGTLFVILFMWRCISNEPNWAHFECQFRPCDSRCCQKRNNYLYVICKWIRIHKSSLLQSELVFRKWAHKTTMLSLLRLNKGLNNWQRLQLFGRNAQAVSTWTPLENYFNSKPERKINILKNETVSDQ